MKKEYLNASNFLKHRENSLQMQQEKVGYLHTDVYLFKIADFRKSGVQNLICYELALYSSTHECYQFEKHFWNNGGIIDMQFQLHLDKQTGAMFSREQIPPPAFQPIIYWINSDGFQCVGTHLFGEFPVILEFNNSWIRMFHNENFEQTPLSIFVEAFNDPYNIGMQESIRWAKNRLTINIASDITDTTGGLPLY